MRPFDGLTISGEVAAGEWILERLAPFASGVGALVPSGVGPCARIAHAVEPEHAEPMRGTLATAQLRALLPLLEASTSTAHRCWFGEWDGFGWWHAGSTSSTYAWHAPGRSRLRASIEVRRARRQDRRRQAERVARLPDPDLHPKLQIPGRDLVLFAGPLDAVWSVGVEHGGGMWREGPTLWWADDRAWVVASDIDLAWSYVTGPPALIGAIVGAPVLEATLVELDDPLA